MKDAFEQRILSVQERKDRKVIDNFPTLRDQFAMAALTGLLSNEQQFGSADQFASWSYTYADAMLEERRNKHESNQN